LAQVELPVYKQYYKLEINTLYDYCEIIVNRSVLIIVDFVVYLNPEI